MIAVVVGARARDSARRERLRVSVCGLVQGVGFRPAVYLIAERLCLKGWVANSLQGALIEVEGPHEALDGFLNCLLHELPPPVEIRGAEMLWLEAVGFKDFTIRNSAETGDRSALVLPDLAVCSECLQELFDTGDRRYRYPFLNCTHCGPRFTIIDSLPYDRPNTSMGRFALCDACRHEYDDPLDRRFHAQPIACPACGPHLELWNKDGELIVNRDLALKAAERALLEGQIVAVKGLGGFHLMADAGCEEAVQRLRERKHRPDKPFALMVPNLDEANRLCSVSPVEARLLTSPAAPIVILERRPETANAPAATVARNNPCLGLMLPYTPLHHLLMRDLGIPIVATSGNRSDEPICLDEQDAVQRLHGIADLFLVHNRPIIRPVDDSVVRVLLDRPMVLRRARGYAPLPVTLGEEAPNAMAFGPHMKNTVALSMGSQAFLSQHIGDLDTLESYAAYERACTDLEGFYQAKPAMAVCDLHPDYASTRFAQRYSERREIPLLRVQHHHAHVLACMAENDIGGPCLGVAWDGTGYGPDGTIWGGEFLQVDGSSSRRVAHIRPFRLPGGDTAIREPRRSAAGLLFEVMGDRLFTTEVPSILGGFSEAERVVLKTSLQRPLNAPVTTSVGRLFDGIASLLGVRQKSTFEGQAAMELEAVSHGLITEEAYSIPITTSEDGILILDWEPMVYEILADVKDGKDLGLISAFFHNALAGAIVEVAEKTEEERVALTGGCFQNGRLLEAAVKRLRKSGFQPLWHQRVPSGDGGVALGQLVAACRRVSEIVNASQR